MEKICWANTENFDEADVVIVGIPDETQSHALRQGAKEAPFRIREISNIRDSYIRNGKKSLGFPLHGSDKKVHDLGNISREEIDKLYNKIAEKKKIPISIGGDHSISRQIIKSLSNKLGKISLVYFDAHPDLVSSTTNYYGSVFYDVLPNINPESSIQIGTRTPEKEELDNINKYNIKVISPFEIQEKGIKKISESILDTIGNNVYISFDMDCIDPAFAPGVSVPVPLGLNSVDAIYFLNKIAEKGIIGIDFMEVCPNYDVKDRTSHLASRMISEIIFSINLKK
jgi:agmatinase